MRRLIFAANWKMHHGPHAGRRFLERFLELVPPVPERELWFFPPAATIAPVAGAARGRPDVHAGAQNVYWEPKGAFTGEMSVSIAREAGAAGALVGHSERRHVFGETDEETRRKVAALLGAGLTAMLCVGEKLEEREGGHTEQVVLRQLDAALTGLGAAALAHVMIAYEPVWAIGTGRNATPEDAAAVHRIIRARLPAGTPVLYGGSVNLKNALSLLAQPEIDGVLVGGASLEADAWAELVGPAARPEAGR
jgi:triosephosphate isomerase